MFFGQGRNKSERPKTETLNTKMKYSSAEFINMFFPFTTMVCGEGCSDDGGGGGVGGGMVMVALPARKYVRMYAAIGFHLNCLYSKYLDRKKYFLFSGTFIF